MAVFFSKRRLGVVGVAGGFPITFGDGGVRGGGALALGEVAVVFFVKRRLGVVGGGSGAGSVEDSQSDSVAGSSTASSSESWML